MSEAAAVRAVVQLPDTPYPGIRAYSYTERGVYFGREKEANGLMRLVVMYGGVLLFSDSGNGKSSLINAGLIPLALGEGLQPHRVRVQPRLGEEIVVERVIEGKGDAQRLLPSIFMSGDATRVTLSSAEFVNLLREKALLVRPLVIFDQFEEWVTLFEEGAAGQKIGDVRKARKDIQDAIVTLLRDPELPVKIVISLREDYLAKLTPLFKEYPRLTDQYLRLAHFRADQIAQLIRQPFEAYPAQFPREIVGELAGRIQREFEERNRSGDVSLTELQIVCRTLLESGASTKEMDDWFTQQGGVQGIQEQYLEQSLAALGPELREPAVCLLTRMVTSAGTRNVISHDDLLSRVQHEDEMPRERMERALESLVQNTKLVRQEPRRDVYYYEISSEFLVGWIQKKSQERQRIAEQRKLDAKRAAEEQVRRKKRLLIVLVSAAIAAMVLAGASLRVGIRKARDARHADSLRLALQAKNDMAVDPERSLLLAVQAAKVTFDSSERIITPEAEKALRESVHVARLRSNLLGHAGEISSMAFDQNGKVLATASEDATIKLWDTNSGALLATLAGHADGIQSVIFDHGGKRLATVSLDGKLKIWDVGSHSLLQDIDLGSVYVDTISFSKDDDAVLGTMSDGTIWGWDPTTGRAVSLSAEQAEKMGDDAFKLALNARHGWKINHQVSISLLRADTGESIHELPTKSVETTFMGLSPDPSTRWLATKNARGAVTVWNSSSIEQSHTLSNLQGGVVYILFSPDGSRLVTKGQDGSLDLWDSSSGTLLYTLSRHTSELTSVAFSGNGALLGAGYKDGTAKIWDLSAERDSVFLADFSMFGSVPVFSPDGKLIAAAEREGKIKIWDSAGKKQVEIAGKGEAMALAMNPDSSRIAMVEQNGAGKIWKVGTDNPGRDLGGPIVNLATFAFTGDGKRLIGVTKDGGVMLWDASGSKLPAPESHSEPLSGAAINFDGSLVALVQQDQTVSVLDVSSGKLLYKLDAEKAGATSAKFSPDGKLLAIYSPDKGLLFFSATEGQQLWSLPEEAGRGYTGFTFTTDAMQLTAMASDGTVRTWSIPSREVLRDIPSGGSQPRVWAFSLIQDAGQLVLVRADGELEKQPLLADDLLKLARKRVTRPPRSAECREYHLQGNECKVADLMEEAGKLAKSDRIGDAEEKFSLAKYADELHEVAVDPPVEARRLAAQNHMERGDSSAAGGDLDKAIQEYRAAQKTFSETQLDAEKRAGRLAGQYHLSRGITQATSLDAPGALTEFRKALEVDPSLGRHADYWNHLCWFGSILRRAQEVMEACETAVRLEPANSMYRDSRGLARALTGDRPGAISDFQVLVKGNLASKAQRDRRLKWLQSLRAGKDPFPNDKTLQSLLFDDND